MFGGGWWMETEGKRKRKRAKLETLNLELDESLGTTVTYIQYCHFCSNEITLYRSFSSGVYGEQNSDAFILNSMSHCALLGPPFFLLVMALSGQQCRQDCFLHFYC